PGITNQNDLIKETDFDLSKWLKEMEDAEHLMDEVEAKADTLQSKVDELLLEV
ncbi:hypothetical protein BDB01DRAFT_706598, partial [Pilobolus umbonatus]